MLAALRQAHDRLTNIGFAGAAAVVALIATSYVYEVASRYFFAAPTIWAYDVAAYALCPMIFLGMPAMTRRGAHISLSYLTDAAPPVARALLRRLILVASVAVCFLCAWITGKETLRQYLGDVVTITAFPISKWWISIFIPYGVLSSGLYFLRALLGESGIADEANAGETPI
jgi:TRAP-type C4-dicarboxylate transport system permease small subunit